MATSDQEQKGVNVPQHKRMAAGAPINGQSLQDKGGKQPTGGLTNAKKK
jgi:hypothetical protein